jgi:hypothetical protein
MRVTWHATAVTRCHVARARGATAISHAGPVTSAYELWPKAI